MADPLEVNSSVRLARSACTEIHHVRAARGTRIRNMKIVILAASPKGPLVGRAGDSPRWAAPPHAAARGSTFTRPRSVVTDIAVPPRYALTAAFQSWTGTQRPLSTRVK